MRLVFMGTPDFAAVSLDALIASEHDILCVISQPDRRRGRGMKLIPSPVKALAQENGLLIYQPEKASDSEFVATLKELNPEVIVVVAYGQILKKPLLELAPRGAINVHASYLPKYRGAAPIQRAIMAGEEETGITIMLMDEHMDTGDILSQELVRIDPDDTAGELHDKLSIVGARLLLKTLDDMEKDIISPIPQDNSLATYAPKITKEEAKIDWSVSSRKVTDLVRGLNPVPGAYTFHSGKLLKIWKAEDAGNYGRDKALPGEIINIDNEEGVYVATGSGSLLIQEVQPENGRRIHVLEYARGYHLEEGIVLGSIN